MSAPGTILIGLGSNLPWQQRSSQRLILDAMSHLNQFSQGPVACSQLYRTSPVDCPPGSGDFVNAAAAFAPRQGLEPLALLDALKAYEAAHGRAAEAVRNAPRALDLDLLAFGALQMSSSRLELPHPRASQRAFVLIPLLDVAPGFVWPGGQQTVAELAAQLESHESVSAIPAAADA